MFGFNYLEIGGIVLYGVLSILFIAILFYFLRNSYHAAIFSYRLYKSEPEQDRNFMLFLMAVRYWFIMTWTFESFTSMTNLNTNKIVYWPGQEKARGFGDHEDGDDE